jgi:hypothetical protein
MNPIDLGTLCRRSSAATEALVALAEVLPDDAALQVLRAAQAASAAVDTVLRAELEQARTEEQGRRWGGR